MRELLRRPGPILILSFALFHSAASSSGAAELKPQTLEAFQRYAAARDAQFDQEVQHDSFLWVDAQAEAKRKDYYQRLQNNEVLIEHVDQRVGGQKFEVPDGMVHHWLGIVFVRGARARDVVRLVEDYDRHSKYYAPEVARSKLLSRDGDHFLVYLRFHKKHILSVTVDTWHEAWYRAIGLARQASRSQITRAQEVEDEGQPDEKLRPEGADRGFLWRMNTYWKFEEKEGGTFVQCESITLTRRIPLLLKPIIEPFVTSVPRESLVGVLTHTRTAALAATTGPEAAHSRLLETAGAHPRVGALHGRP
jgi:hypothetical protein